MRQGEPKLEGYARSAARRDERPRLTQAFAWCLLLGAAVVGCADGPAWVGVAEPSRVAPWRPIDAAPANMAPLGRDAVEKLGYARIIELARKAGFVKTKKVPRAAPAEGAMVAMTAAEARVAAEVFIEVFSEYAVTAGVASQLDSPLPGPGDLAALGILVYGLYDAGVMTAEDLEKARARAATGAAPPSAAASASAAPTAASVPTVTAAVKEAPKTCRSEYPELCVCAELPREYTYLSEGAALAEMKAKLRDKSLSLHKPNATTSGPCRGRGQHYNVRQGGGRAASITCCPCCIDDQAGPQESRLCRIVW